jgi:hypothetical protein
MTATPSAPVLRGSGGAVLRHEDDALTLRRGDEETRIPLRAVRDVVPDGRAVTVKLRVPAGATPVVHRVEGSNAAAVSLFATAMGTALAGLPESDPSFDGAALVTTRSLRTPPTPRTPVSAGAQARAGVWLLVTLVPGLATLVGTSVLFVMHGEPGMLLLAVPMGIVTVLFNATSGVTAQRATKMWLLPWRGITVMAVRTSPYGKRGIYEYTDPSGKTHSYYRDAYASEIEICYHPDDPAESVGVYPVYMRVLATLGALVLWAVTAGLIFVAIMAATE